MNVQNVRHTGIVVRDMERSLAFYRDLLGLKPVIDFVQKGRYIDTLLGMKGADLHMVKLVAEGGGMVELLHFRSHRRSRPARADFCRIGPTHVALTVDRLDDAYETLRARRVPFVAAPIASPDGKARVAFCRDPDGTFIELVEVLA